ncbi:MAG: recombinase family protein [Kiritimatiellae bacterium]|nr:recombinase family protein [Kiritimatiellia bacterium]
MYTRKSLDIGLEKDFSSIDAQYAACKSYIEARREAGWRLLPERYDDGGFSGTDMDRPAMKRLLLDIEAGLVDVIAVYKIDRISRSMADFAEFLSLLEKHRVSLASVTQDFIGPSGWGRAMMGMLMTFAQYEREMISERVRDKTVAMRRKGMWTGGIAPFGYAVCDKRLVPDQRTAGTVRELFRLYAETGSCKAVAARLNGAGLPWRPGVEGGWNPRRVGYVLRNVASSGLIMCEGTALKGVQEAIVGDELRDRVGAALERKSRPRATAQSPSGAILNGLLRCGTCGSAMVYSWTRKKTTGAKYGYYMDRADSRRAVSTCPVRRVPEGPVEALLEDAAFPLASRVKGTEAARAADPDVFWASMPPEEKKTLFRRLFREVVVNPHSIDIVFQSGEVKTVPASLRRNGGKNMLVSGNAKDPILVAYARARAFWRMLDSGRFKSVSEMARHYRIERTYFGRLLSMACVSPRIIKAVMSGRAPAGLTVNRLMRLAASDWTGQEKLLGLKCNISISSGQFCAVD